MKFGKPWHGNTGRDEKFDSKGLVHRRTPEGLCTAPVGKDSALGDAKRDPAQSGSGFEEVTLLLECRANLLGGSGPPPLSQSFWSWVLAIKRTPFTKLPCLPSFLN